MSGKTQAPKEGDTVRVLGSPNATTLEPTVPKTLTQEIVKPKKGKVKADPEAFKEVFTNVGKINVKPYIDPNRENMGLEDYGFAIFPGTQHE
jgi:hypothetical protein